MLVLNKNTGELTVENWKAYPNSSVRDRIRLVRSDIKWQKKEFKVLHEDKIETLRDDVKTRKKEWKAMKKDGTQKLRNEVKKQKRILKIMRRYLRQLKVSQIESILRRNR